ncbi:MAG TPA: MFS transporter [Stellaceae bacterium]|nr:MFS transporter [Stellaceae bacterium]
MSGRDANRADREVEKGSWGELFSGGRGLYTALVIGGIAMHGTQILVIAIIMPTIVADIGGAVYYTWAAMIYTIGSIVGASSTGAVWSKFGARNGYALGAAIFALGTTVCALAPDMATLVVARGAQGWAGGLVSGGGTALIASLYDARLRTRILALSQGAFTLCHLSGPIVGGVFATIHWWRGSFWLMVPFMVAFAILARLKIPDRLDTEAERGRLPPFPLFRLATLAIGVFCVAATGPIDNTIMRIALIAAAVGLVGLAFRLDRDAGNRLFPSRALSLTAPVGLSLWILTLHGMSQTSVTLFLPLLLQVVHGVSPLFVNFVTIIISFGWTVGTVWSSGWSGARERVALWAGPLLAFVSLVTITLVARLPALEVLAGSAFVMGIGVGIYNVHLVARTMAGAAEGEQRVTAAALTSIRSLGTAFGAAIAGVIANAAGLGDATEPEAVAHAVTSVYVFCWIPLGLAVVFMFRFLRIAMPRAAPVPASAD